MERKSLRLQQEQARRDAALLEAQTNVEKDIEAQVLNTTRSTTRSSSRQPDSPPPVQTSPNTLNTTTASSSYQQPATTPVSTAAQVSNTTTGTSTGHQTARQLLPSGGSNILVAPPVVPLAAPPVIPVPAPLVIPVAAPPTAPAVLSIRCRNAADGVEAVVRRIIYSNKTSKIASATVGGRIKLEYSDFHGGPKSATNCSLLVRDIGVEIRIHVPMTASTFYALTKEEKATVGTYLENYYDIPKSDVEMWRFIDTKLYERFKAWKHKCHSHYKKHGDPVPFEFLNRTHEWDYLVDNEFRNEKKISISVRNTNNRTSNPNPINHCAGARALSYMAEEHLLAGHLAPYCAATVDAYITSKNGREKALALKRKLDEIIEERVEAEDTDNLKPLSVENQCNLTTSEFGQRKGTEVRGFRAALKRAAKARCGPRSNIAQLEEMNREAVDRVEQAEEKTRMLEDRVKVMEAALQKFLDAQSGNDE